MSKKELKKVFNLNSYEWWRNHRRVVTFGGFLILFAWFISPVIKQAANKNRCIEVAKKRMEFLVKEEYSWANNPKEFKKKSGVSLKEFLDLEAYKNCSTNYEILQNR